MADAICRPPFSSLFDLIFAVPVTPDVGNIFSKFDR